MNISKYALPIVYHLKPILIKIMPNKFLRNQKEKLIQKQTEKLANISIKPYDFKMGTQGINLIGYIKHDTGLGQSTRLLARELKESTIDFSIKPYSQSQEYSMSDTSFDKYITDKLPHNINIFHINPHEFTVAYLNIGKKLFDYHYNIAFWLWEMEDFPDEWIPCIDLLDEIWTPSEFISEAIRKKTNKPVVTMPYAINAPVISEMKRSYFSLPNNVFLFLGMYDSNSVSERKNPSGIIRAFKAAFAKDDDSVGLVLKVNHIKEGELQSIQTELEGYRNVYYIFKNLTKLEVNSLIKCVDVYVSLHRAEGFGLVLAEAMLLGTPTIATNYSANVEFMNKEIACMVDYEMITLEKDIALYHRGSKWADPSICQTAKYMKLLLKDKQYYEEKKKKSQEYITNKLNLKSAVSKIESRVCAIYQMQSSEVKIDKKVDSGGE